MIAWHQTAGRLSRFALAAFALLAGPIAARTAEPVTYPFQFQAGLIFVQVACPGSPKPLEFLLDSGAEASVIDLRAARRLHLERGQAVTVRGVTGTSRGYWPEHLRATLGEVPLPTNYLAMDLASLGAACHQHVDGLIGAEFFAGRVVRINFTHRTLELLDASPATNAEDEVLPLQVTAQRLRVPVTVAGLGSAWARLDTGCASALHWTIAPAATGSPATPEVAVGVGVTSEQVRENNQTVHLGRLALANIPTGLHPEKLLTDETGLLGSGLLSRFSVVTIDTLTGRLLLTGLRP